MSPFAGGLTSPLSDRDLETLSLYPEITDSPAQQLARRLGYLHVNAHPPGPWDQHDWTTRFSETPFRANAVATFTPEAFEEWTARGEFPHPLTFKDLELPPQDFYETSRKAGEALGYDLDWGLPDRGDGGLGPIRRGL